MVVFVNLRDNCLKIGPLSVTVRSGKAGYIAAKQGQEGDAKTPLGTYYLRFGLYRNDRLPYAPPSASAKPLTWRALRPDDGWCDDPSDAAYNRFIKRPYRASHEALWRDDGAYDIILVMSHNDSPPHPNLGSAVFIHIAQSDDRQTLGCLALAPEDMIRLLPYLQQGMPLRIRA